MHDIFTAGVQYDDFTGSVAADQADEIGLVDYLREREIATTNEIVMGVRVGFGGNHGSEMPMPGVVVYLADKDWRDHQPRRLRAVEVEITMAQLLSFYKRFDLVMTRHRVELDGVEVDGPYYG